MATNKTIAGGTNEPPKGDLEQARVLWGGGDVDPYVAAAVKAREKDLRIKLGETSEAIAARVARHTALARRHDFDPMLREKFVEVEIDAQLADNAGRAVTLDEVRALTEQTREKMHARYGADGADQYAAQVHALAAGDPELQAVLQLRDIGSREDVVGGLMQHVRLRGRE